MTPSSLVRPGLLSGVVQRRRYIKRTSSMEQKQNGKPSMLAEAIAALFGAGAGSGLGWVIWLATGNIAVAIGIAGPIAALTNSFLRRVMN